MTGKYLYTVVAVSFGLLCIVQVALNIFLRLYFYGNTEVYKNVTEERDELKRKLAGFNAVIEEQEELKRKLIDSVVASPEGWQYFKGSLYYISSTAKTWNDSREDCLAKGADLMIINSDEKQNFTRQLKDDMWIGLTVINAERKMQWVDGTPLTTSYWMESEPNNYESRGEDCVEVRLHELINSWNDEPCDFENFWICEKKL